MINGLNERVETIPLSDPELRQVVEKCARDGDLSYAGSEILSSVRSRQFEQPITDRRLSYGLFSRDSRFKNFLNSFVLSLQYSAYRFRPFCRSPLQEMMKNRLIIQLGGRGATYTGPACHLLCHRAE